jgi:DNA-binding transcriptional MerR regulator
MESDSYKIGEVATKLATSIRSIRYYEEEGLLTPIRTQRGTRLYSEKHISRLSTVLRLTKLGFSIESIRNIAKLRESSKTGDESSSLVDSCLNETIATINNKIKELENLNVEINNSLSIVKKCKGCANHPTTKECPNCPVINNLKNIQLLNLIWDTE